MVSAMPFEVSRNGAEIMLGLFIVLGTLCLVYVAWERWNALDTRDYVVYADFASVSGLRVGDPVEIAGVEVGAVESISLADYQARVALGVQEGVDIREDAMASIQLEGLMGDRSVSIDPGIVGKPLEPGEKIKRTESPQGFQFLLGRLLAGDILSS
jgi:phospholipid/cholesterol/gamma-HCH transport system substrate-binding protein